MEDKDSGTKTRRPLPTPIGLTAPPQRPSTPTVVGALNSSSTPPQLPTRPQGIGSNHTTTNYIPDQPPTYSSADFREPELVHDDQVMTEDFSTIGSSTWNQRIGTTSYEDSVAMTWGGIDGGSNWNSNRNYEPTSTSYWDSTYQGYSGYMSSSWFPSMDPYAELLDGRVHDEEVMWWDPEFDDKLAARPGPGMLACEVAEQLHNSNHALYTIRPSLPTIQPSTSNDDTQTAENSSNPSSASPPPPRRKTPPPPPPTEQEIQAAIPHPYALYCPKENGWVLVHYDTTSREPPLSRTFQASKHNPLPEHERRQSRVSCLDNEILRHPNKTHHFHKYEGALDARSIKPPFHVDEWETIETLKQRRRAGKVIPEDFDLENMKAEDDDEDLDDSGKLLDLYMCCQCRVVCISSSLIPGVIPRAVWHEFIAEKKKNPAPGISPELSVIISLETLLMATENKLWKGETRRLRITRPGFQRKMGWTPVIQRVFESLGFEMETFDTEHTLTAPKISVTDPQGKQNRAKLIRAWLEIGAWLKDFITNNRHTIHGHKQYVLSVQLESARERYQRDIGSDPNSMPRSDLSITNDNNIADMEYYFRLLGLTISTFTPELLTFAYLAQCRCDPINVVKYFTALKRIVHQLQDQGNCPNQLLELVTYENSRERFSDDDVLEAALQLGIGEEARLKVAYDSDLPDDFIMSAWKDVLKSSWLEDSDEAQRMQRGGLDALKMIAEHRRSATLRKFWEEHKDVMTPQRAYDTMEIPQDVDDQMIITVYSIRCEEQPAQLNKMRSALELIAEVRNSDRLRQFLQSGQDPGDTLPTVSVDWPRGLNQLGNTCYLNSLLQYFNTIKDLRETVLAMRDLDVKATDDDKLTDDDLKRHRVGGRLVTRREILRSKRFVLQLAELFYSMEHSDTVSVTPSIELAKLALVTSKDEEDGETDKGGTDSSNDTDATLVDDTPSGYTTAAAAPSGSPTRQSPARTSDSVLGKRGRGIQQTESAMDVDNMDIKDDSPPPLVPADVPSTVPARDKDGDFIMRSDTPTIQKPPPLPPRKHSESVMMFGRQHDVAECMDNCMFQIETALLKFDGMDNEEGSDKTSVVKRLFYGKTRQHLLIPPDPNKARTPLEPKVELFNHLPVNVDEEGYDIYDALGRYFDDIVDYEGQRVPMQLGLLDLPPLLQIQLQRVQFDRDTLQSWKSQAYVKFEETIYLDRFLDSADPQKRARSKQLQEELNSCRDRIRVLSRRKDGSCITALSNIRDFLTVNEFGANLVDEELIFNLQEEESLIQTEIEELRNRMVRYKAELEAIWQDHRAVAYELTSVFIHRGTSPSWGHYFFYSRHLPESPDVWFKYNDSEVSTISREEVLADTTGSTANPYLLVFARKGSEVVDTVKRYDPSDFIHQDYEKSRA